MVSGETVRGRPAPAVSRDTSLSGRKRLQRPSRSRRRSRASPVAPGAPPTTMTWQSEPMTRKRRASTVGLDDVGMTPWSRRLLRVGWGGARSTRRLGARREPEAVADAPHGLDQRRLAGVDLLAQVADVRLEHA